MFQKDKITISVIKGEWHVQPAEVEQLPEESDTDEPLPYSWLAGIISIPLAYL
eukprot:COSAG02_NODE_3308_length_6959_cov_3.565015_3_plen_53_part_00